MFLVLTSDQHFAFFPSHFSSSFLPHLHFLSPLSLSLLPLSLLPSSFLLPPPLSFFLLPCPLFSLMPLLISLYLLFQLPLLSHLPPIGKLLSVVILVATEPAQYAAYTHAIKVTVDGPREPRRKSTSTPTIQRTSLHTHCPTLRL